MGCADVVASAHAKVPEDITVVKFQTIVREAKEIVVGRIKVPIVSDSPKKSCPGHSLTTSAWKQRPRFHSPPIRHQCHFSDHNVQGRIPRRI
jgi:hypothetical protein